MVRVFIGLVLATLLAAAVSCVDVEDGESGTYGSPCGNYGGLLLCDRENGGADPEGGGGPNPGGGDPGGGGANCTTVCQVVVTCFPGQISQGECEASCASEGIPQSVMDCIIANQCNYPSACFGDS